MQWHISDLGKNRYPRSREGDLSLESRGRLGQTEKSQDKTIAVEFLLD